MIICNFFLILFCVFVISLPSFARAATSDALSEAPPEVSERNSSSNIKNKQKILNGIPLTFKKNKYGDPYVTFSFKVNRENSIPFIPGVVPRYEGKPKKKFTCGENFEFFIKKSSLPFFRTLSKKGRIIVRGTDRQACSEIKSVFNQEKPDVELNLRTYPEHWKFTVDHFDPQGGANNLFVEGLRK